MNYQKRPWYSFRWKILFWIALPFIWITIADSVAMWMAARTERSAVEEVKRE